MTARLLLMLLFTGVFVPVALAISAPAPHACCMRKPMHQPGDAEFQAPPGCCNHDCCRPLTVSHFAQLKPAASDIVSPRATGFLSNAEPTHLICAFDVSHAGRAPPQVSLS